MKTATPEQFARELAEALPTQLKSVVLYGSAAAGDFVEGASNYNLLAVVDPLGVDELDAVSSAIVEWNRRGYPTPLLFTREQLAESVEAFPIELLDIQQSRRVLWGDDLLAEICIQPANLERQVQRDLIGKLLKLRGRYALTEGRSHMVTVLMLRSLSTFLVLFRAALRLYQDTVPETKLDALLALARHIPFDTRPFERLLELKQLSGESRSALPDVSFESYLHAIECVANTVNRRNSHPVGSKT